ncbi:MAG: AtpZ/AtpI family protein [Magnetospirillum sp. WYHS-4]
MKRARAEAEAPEGRGPALKVSMTGFGMAFRIGTEMVAALGLGVAIGILLDRWLGTSPGFLVVFFFLGAGAGALNVYRAACGIGMAPGYRRPGDDRGDGPPEVGG